MTDKPKYASVDDAEIKRQIAEDPDDWESSAEELAQAKPFREVFPDLAASIDREIAKRGRPSKPNARQAVTIRLDPETVAKFKARGKDWRLEMAKELDKAAG